MQHTWEHGTGCIRREESDHVSGCLRSSFEGRRSKASALFHVDWILIVSQDQLPPCFVETWSYASALSVVEQCDIWAAEADLESSAVAGFNSAKAELLEHARKQVKHHFRKDMGTPTHCTSS
jgi:hypothetical protein